MPDHDLFRGELMLIYVIIQHRVHSWCSISKQKKTQPDRYVRMVNLAEVFFIFMHLND